MSTSEIAFIIPAYNAAETLAQCLESIRAQTNPAWEAIVIDDGSTDATFQIAQQFSECDGRIRVFQQENAGAAAARNAGMARADSAFASMLDADDWIDEHFIEFMLPVARSRVGPAIAYCSYRRVEPSGKIMPVAWAADLSGDLAKITLSSYCAIGIHCAVFPRSLYLDLGGMNTDLAICEDWDLWLRMAFAGANFVRVEKCLGFYRLTEGSLTSDPRRLVSDTVKFTELAAGLQERNPFLIADEALKTYMQAPIVQVKMLAWVTATTTAKAVSPPDLALLLPQIPDLLGLEDFMAATVLDGLQVGFRLDDTHDLLTCPEQWQPRIDALFALFEAAGAGGLRRGLWQALLLRIAASGRAGQPVQIGDTLIFEIDLDAIEPVARPASADSGIAVITAGGTIIAVVPVPLWGNLSARSIMRIISRNVSLADHVRPRNWFSFAGAAMPEVLRQHRALLKLLRYRHMRRARLKQIVLQTAKAALENSVADAPDDNEHRARTTVEKIMAALPKRPAEVDGAAARPALSAAAANRQDYWEGIFESADPWNYLSVYEQLKYQQTLDLLPAERIGTALELACAEGIFTEKLAPRVETLIAADISARALERAAKRCAAYPNTSFRQLDLVSQVYPGGQDLIICSEVFYYFDGVEQLKIVAARIAEALKEGGQFITAHVHQVVDEPGRTGFDWGFQFGVGTIRQVFAETPGLYLEKAVDTELYSVLSFRKGRVPEPVVERHAFGEPLELSVARHILWGGVGTLRSDAWLRETTSHVPVLTYHRIADDGPDSLSRYRTSPAAFREQMRFLRRHGFYSIDSGALWRQNRELRPFKGRPVLITFDDAYRDFADNAFPILAENDLLADVFVVTDKAGGCSDWDERHGPAAPLMDWQTMRDLHLQGIGFGSHLASHTAVTGLSSANLLSEAARSRAMLQHELGSDIQSIALPYGIYDARVPPTLELAGYRIAFSTRSQIAALGQNPLHVPRLEVAGGMTLDQFAQMLGIR